MTPVSSCDQVHCEQSCVAWRIAFPFWLCCSKRLKHRKKLIESSLSNQAILWIAISFVWNWQYLKRKWMHMGVFPTKLYSTLTFLGLGRKTLCWLDVNCEEWLVWSHHQRTVNIQPCCSLARYVWMCVYLIVRGRHSWCLGVNPLPYYLHDTP